MLEENLNRGEKKIKKNKGVLEKKEVKMGGLTVGKEGSKSAFK
ncbi:MAG: hypothetical protein ACTSP1_16115 [Candidatus Freyarchaeota archaeon]